VAVLGVQRQGTNQLAAFYVSADDSLDDSLLRLACAEELPDYMIPRYFVRLEALPVNANGKIDRRRLTELI
jgi:acyl-CoA synthetase (AMP-forming)/AMP-acid ligase II